MNARPLKEMIWVNLKRRPLWSVRVLEDFFSLTRQQVIEKIENGDFPWAFNVGCGTRRKEIRLLGHGVTEKTIGPFPEIGATKNLKLIEVVDLILPQRDVRSTELRRIFSCSSKLVYDLAKDFRVAKKAMAKDGPYSYTVFQRASVAKFLENRRML